MKTGGVNVAERYREIDTSKAEWSEVSIPASSPDEPVMPKNEIIRWKEERIVQLVHEIVALKV